MTRSDGDAAKRRRMAAGPGQLPPELLANIHDRLEFLDRIAFATVFAASSDDGVFSTPAPWLLLPGEKENDPSTATLFSVADRRAATVRVADPVMRRYQRVIGSSRGWLATVDGGQIHLVNPATGEQHTFPDITTMGVFLPRPHGDFRFAVSIERFLAARFGGGPPFGDNCWGPEGKGTSKSTFHPHEMRTWFYQKVVLAIGRSPRSHAAMLILDRNFGAPAFATAEDGAGWRLAPSCDGVEDAIYHDGRFHSVSYSGIVEAWERDAVSGAYTSKAVAPRLLTTIGIGGEEEARSSRKYRTTPLAPRLRPVGRTSRKYLAAAPGGRLMVVVKHVQVSQDERYPRLDRWTWSFKVHVLGDNGQWKETRDIGDAAVFVGLNNSLCLLTIGRLEMEAGCVYYADDELWEAALRKHDRDMDCYSDSDDERDGDVVDEARVYNLRDVQAVGVYNLKDGTVTRVEGLNRRQYRGFTYTPPVWITPSIP